MLTDQVKQHLAPAVFLKRKAELLWGWDTPCGRGGWGVCVHQYHLKAPRVSQCLQRISVLLPPTSPCPPSPTRSWVTLMPSLPTAFYQALLGSS